MPLLLTAAECERVAERIRSRILRELSSATKGFTNTSLCRRCHDRIVKTNLPDEEAWTTFLRGWKEAYTQRRVFPSEEPWEIVGALVRGLIEDHILEVLTERGYRPTQGRVLFQKLTAQDSVG